MFITAAAMEALNAKGVVHRDIKPHNLLLTYPPGDTKPTDIKIKIGKLMLLVIYMCIHIFDRVPKPSVIVDRYF